MQRRPTHADLNRQGVPRKRDGNRLGLRMRKLMAEQRETARQALARVKAGPTGLSHSAAGHR